MRFARGVVMKVAALVALAVSLGGVASLGAPPEKPASREVRDPADSAGPFDLAVVSAWQRMKGGGSEKRRVFVLRLRTYDRWRPQLLLQQGKNFLSFEFDRNRNMPADRCLDVRGNLDGTLVGQMKRPCVPVGARHLGRPIRVTRPDARTVRAVVPRRLLGRQATRWRATSSFEVTGDESCAPPTYPPPESRYGACVDFTRWTNFGG